ncbi:hypothetical protein ABW21_db0202032 [Orbilia brochopaga]|nr:hypothetical protein ABW21_db0202032 [Drechslerella brochopaga]
MAISSRPGSFIIHGTLIDTPTPHALRVREDVFCVVDDGVIVQICKQENEILTQCRDFLTVKLSGTQMIVPGLIDLHIQYTYPAEAAFASEAHASSIYPKLITHLLKNGTTTAVLFGSNHLAATKILAESCAAAGIRALVGKTCADILTPDEYVETTADSLRATEEFVDWCIKKWGGGDSAIVRPVVTPRFIPTCSSELLKGLGDIAQKYDCFVQSHAAESVDEEALVQIQHPGRRDISIFREAGLLRDRCVLAHCCRLRDVEAVTMQEVGATVVSCPFSNILFARATVPIPRYNRDFPSLKIGLGTDIAGGFGTMLDNMRTAILQDRIDSFATVDRDASADGRELNIESANWTVDFKYAFHLATAAGAHGLGMQESLGTFDEGKRFDALLLDCGLEEDENGYGGQRFTRFGDEGVAELFEKWVTTGDDRNIVKVWVDGKVVRGA